MKATIVIVIILCMLTGCMASAPNMEGTELSRLPETQQTDAMPSESSPNETENQTDTEPANTEESASVDPLAVLLNSMTLEERIGQLFLVRCPEEPLEEIAEYHFGGFVLFGGDFEDETPDSLRNAVSSYQSASQIPMLIAVDEEGGTVCRVSDYAAFRSQRFLSPRRLLAEGGVEALLEEEEPEEEPV